MLVSCLFFFLITDVSLMMKEDVTLITGDIFLKDVLTAASYEQLTSRGIRNTRIARSPDYNRTRSIHRNTVANTVHRSLPDLDIQFKGPGTANVHRRGGTFSSESVDDAVRAWIEAEATLRAAGDVEIMRLVVPKVLKVPPGPVTYRIRPRGNMEMVGRQALYVDLLVNDRNFRTLVVSVELSLQTMVAVAIGNLERGDLLNERNVVWEFRRIDRINSPLLSPDSFGEQRARTMIRAGTVLAERHVELVPLVHRNQMVFVTARRGALKITLRAKALDNGGMGETVRLKNLDSGQIMRGLVDDKGEVALEF